MISDYSKPSADIALEVRGWTSREQETLAFQREISQYLQDAPAREECLLCASSLAAAERIRHRSIEYRFCTVCGHLQSAGRLPHGYPWSIAGSGFETVYPPLDANAFASRRDRIYLPKLEWALACLEEAGIGRKEALASSWLELGCGGGYFLDALQRSGVTDLLGLDENESLVNNARSVVGERAARCTGDMNAELSVSGARIIVAFFVLEHLENAQEFWQLMAAKPAGTVFLLAVPTFGLSTLLEAAFDGFAARNLDSVVHTQLYTDRSLDHAASVSGYEKIAEWLFGQDAADLCRVLANRLSEGCSDGMRAMLKRQLAEMVDPLQTAIDRQRLCDARHVLLIKK